MHNYLPLAEEVKRILNHETTILPIIISVTELDTNMRQAISANERLALTLRFLATGRSFEDLNFSTIISPTTLSEIVMEVCNAIIELLADYIKIPLTGDEWEKIAKDSGAKWQFWNCLGAIDGKHVHIIKPANFGSRYYNYKGTHSIVLMAIVDANYNCIMVDVGTNGRVSDGGVLYNTDFWEMFQNNRLNISDASKLPNTAEKFLYVFIGDDAFCAEQTFIEAI
ncbi:uncharacterized protein LOC126744353 [Anthonomus grandis grandis]|uniref:uncharacterized protein LOC126744353 n=1 Tax=Anthonomus grandis grandis TaxID=2921223 RepID=UPI0021653AFD|nr:uncharacterized protein LOC126744353 [Anthonomus grandis grandis]